MERQQRQENAVPLDRLRDPEAQLGGADAVEKTTYVVGEGTDPQARKGDGPSATGVSRRATTIVLAIVLTIVALVAFAYLIGIGR